MMHSYHNDSYSLFRRSSDINVSSRWSYLVSKNLENCSLVSSANLILIYLSAVSFNNIFKNFSFDDPFLALGVRVLGFKQLAHLTMWCFNGHFFHHITAQKMKFSIKDFFSKCDQISSFLRILLHLQKKSLIINFIFCVVYEQWYLTAIRLSLCENLEQDLLCIFRFSCRLIKWRFTPIPTSRASEGLWMFLFRGSIFNNFNVVSDFLMASENTCITEKRFH